MAGRSAQRPNQQDHASTRAARTRCPAKLNLFLELLGRRDDGFHEIDTIMVPVNWCDELILTKTDTAGISIQVEWLPSPAIIAARLGIAEQSDRGKQLLGIPEDENNLVHRALSRFSEQFSITGGFECRILKRIPAGAGMGGASSNAASALHCAAQLCEIDGADGKLHEIAASIGSDVPFFLGFDPTGTTFAARARGRGEVLTGLTLTSPLHFVVAFPGECLSTAQVYAASQIPQDPSSPERILGAFEKGSPCEIGQSMFNRLGDPARKILPRINEILDSMWRCGLQACQLTGSGSACFAIEGTAIESERGSARLRGMLEPGALISNVYSIGVPTQVVIE